MTEPLISLDEALRILAEALPGPACEELLADRDDPPADRSTMDGAALRSLDGLGVRRVAGVLHAGEDPSGLQVGPGQAVRVMTGAVVPAGADAVVPVEDLVLEGPGLRPIRLPVAGQFILPRASQGRKGELLLGAGFPLSAAGVGLRAQVGALPPLLRRIRVGIAPTGDELVADPLPHQIRDSNGPMLEALAFRLGAEVHRLEVLRDDPASVRAFFASLGDLDILLTCGGVSMGDRDFLPEALEERGARILFRRIRLKPGKPTLAALLGKTLVLALPGNPLSAYLNALLFLPVALARLGGWRAPDPWCEGELADPVRNGNDRPLLHPCRLAGKKLHPMESKGSADLGSLARAEACAWIPEGGLQPGPARFLHLL